MHTNYARTFAFGSYLGMAETGLFCNQPLMTSAIMDQPMSSPDYVCNATDTPIDYPNWDPKWFSPVCRPWYQMQAETPY